MQARYKIIIFCTVLLFGGFGCKEMVKNTSQNIEFLNNNEVSFVNEVEKKRIHFSEFSDIYKFSALILPTWKVEYIPELESVSIYDDSLPGVDSLEKSQIFIRHFRADKFLTLGTVDILERSSTFVHGHEAVSYEIKKKSGVANFSGQPFWRSEQHKLVDIRFGKKGQGEFYVFSYNPELEVDIFNNFLESLVFDNDVESFIYPLKDGSKRITKKPFGLFVEPDSSPVQPEKFFGYHTGTDFEIFSGEDSIDVVVNTICGGKIKSKKQINGYGGVVVQSCNLNGEQVSVVYGHLKLSSTDQLRVGTYLKPGATVGVLGKGFSEETFGERKHLHLGIYKGSNENVGGYVTNKSALEAWIDLETIIKNVILF